MPWVPPLRARRSRREAVPARPGGVVEPAAPSRQMTSTDELFLPEPAPREVKFTVISVDDHLVEPPDMFEGRLPAGLQERAPRIVETRKGHQVWEFDGNFYSQVGMNAVAGRRPETVEREPFRFDQMRRGCWAIGGRTGWGSRRYSRTTGSP